MSRVSEELRMACLREPELERDVVITLADETPDTRAAAPEGAVGIEGVPGVMKARMKGARILDLEERREILEVTEDFDVEAL